LPRVKTVDNSKSSKIFGVWTAKAINKRISLDDSFDDKSSDRTKDKSLLSKKRTSSTSSIKPRNSAKYSTLNHAKNAKKPLKKAPSSKLDLKGSKEAND